MGVRDNRVDSIRGLMLAIMLLDHLGGTFKIFSWQPLGYVSAAEGFVFLSGYMFALVYARPSRTVSDIFKLSIKRAALIYKYHSGCLFLILTLTMVIPGLAHYWRALLGGLVDHPLYYGAWSLLLIEAPRYFDILPMYIVFVVVTPGIIWALRHNAAWLVAAASLLLWLIGGVFNPADSLANALGDGSITVYFNLLSWQLLWTMGVFLGVYRNATRVFVQRLNRGTIAALLGFGIALFLLRHHLLTLGVDPLAVDRHDLGWLRMANFLTLTLLFGWIVSLLPVDMKLPWFGYIGRQSIQVFSFHILIVYFSAVIDWRIEALGGPPLYAVYCLACLASLTLPAFLAYRSNARARAAKAAAETRPVSR